MKKFTFFFVVQGKEKMMKQKKRIILPVIMILLLVIVTTGVAYAVFTFSREGTIENTLEIGTIMLTYTEGKTGIILEEAFPISDEKGKMLTGANNVFDFTVQAVMGKPTAIAYEVSAIKIPVEGTSLEDNEVKIYLEKAVDPEIEYSQVMEPKNFLPSSELSEIGSPIGTMVLDQGTFTSNTIHHYRLRMWVDENAKINNVQKKYAVKINVYAKQGVILDDRNKNILNIYAYNQEKESSTFCVTGEEETCQEIFFAPSTYEVGTIIKYKVNDTTEKYFHVLNDNGNTLTLQQRENTVYNTAWYADENDNSKGPTTILSALENAIADWTNVLDQTYTLGTTVFKDNAFTGCNYDSTNKVFNCVTNTYQLEKVNIKVRMVSVQEAHALGCTNDKMSCPVWMYNYLKDAPGYGGTVDDNTNSYGYWMISSQASNTTNAWSLDRYGYIRTSVTAIGGIGGRAVINIKK